MGKYYLLIISVFCFFSVSAQFSVQLHNDLGSKLYPSEMDGRAQVTSSVAMQKADKWGSTFLLVDLDYSSKGITSTFFKLSRKLSFWEKPIYIQFDYKGGLNNHMSFNNNYLLGGAYTLKNKDFSRMISFGVLYKYIQNHSSPHNYQLTCIWSVHFAKRLCSFNGFADFGRDKNKFGDFSGMAKPQIWINLNQIKGIDQSFNLSVGSTQEITYNQGGLKGLYAVPSLSVKWTFN